MRTRLAAGLLAGAAVLSGCGSGLSFRADHRLDVTSPRSRTSVHLPVTVRWTMRDFDHPGGYYALFVDRAPVRPGQTVESLADGDCRRTPGCPDRSYLAARGVYTTAGTSLTLTAVDPVNSYDRIQTHEVTIVLMDRTGRRIGESAWYVDFRLPRGTY